MLDIPREFGCSIEMMHSSNFIISSRPS